MSYSTDLRRRVLAFVEEGGSKAMAARLFKVHPSTIYEWLKRGEDLAPRPSTTRRRKLDKEALARHVCAHPDALLRERAAHFGVRINSVWVAMRRMGFVKKRRRYSERGITKRMDCLRRLHELTKRRGGERGFMRPFRESGKSAQI